MRTHGYSSARMYRITQTVYKGNKMVYLESFQFPDDEKETDFFYNPKDPRLKRTCYDSYYPFQVLSGRKFRRVDFEPITVFYGGNGCGKTTALNVIAAKLGLERDTPYNRSEFFEDYLGLCDAEMIGKLPKGSRIITSDDVFDYMLNVRAINNGVERRREDLFEEYLEMKYSNFRMRSMDDYDTLKKVNMARSKTQSKYVRANTPGNVREYSNGESAWSYFCEKIGENGLYLLDEPENSLSPKRQMELMKFLEDSARFFGCQFVISTHSPFLLAMRGAKIYDLDEDPVDVKRWTELENVRIYYEFFCVHREEFL